MKATVVNFRGARHTQYGNQMIIAPAGSQKREDAEKLVGKVVTFICEGKSKKHITGKVASSHGKKGAIRVIFEKGMPGQAISKNVEIQ